MPALTDAVPAGEAVLLRRARDEFAAVFGRGATVAAAAPGRVNLMGDHVDYCEGYVLPVVSRVPYGIPIWKVYFT